MKYMVIENDECSNDGEEIIYVFEHTKNRNTEVQSLEDFAAKCVFIETRNSHMYWYQGKNVEDVSVFELEKNIKAQLKEFIELTKEDISELRNRFSKPIQPFTFPHHPIKSAYISQPDWNDLFFVLETKNSYFGLHWYTTA